MINCAKYHRHCVIHNKNYIKLQNRIFHTKNKVRFFPLDEQRYLICTISGEISNISRMNRKEDTVVLFCFG